MNIKKNILIIAYPIFFFLFTLGVSYFLFPDLLHKRNFLNWDAEHYFWIKNHGYEGFRVAFFPLFPILWKITHLSIYGIVLLNISIFLLGFYLLANKLGFTAKEILLYLTIPSFCFFFLPYTEALFFTCSVILLLGLKTNKIYLVYLGLFLSTLTRPAFTVFIPAFIVMEFLSYKINTATILRILSYIAVTVIGMVVVGWIQFNYTGKWFEFFEAQKGWGNHLQIPKLPLDSWGGRMILRADGACLLIGIISGIIILGKVFKKGSPQAIQVPKEVIFSLSYLAGISLTVLLFRGGSLFSLNRFLLATPFILVAFNYYLKQKITFSNKFLALIFFAIFAFWLFFGSYLHFREVLFFFAFTVYLILFFLLNSEHKVNNFAIITLIILNFSFQMIFYIKFLNKDWVG